MPRATTHILGAGLAGLSAAAFLAGHGQQVIVYEAASQAGGRCRSYYDVALNTVIDNGNHLLLSGNKAALAYLQRIGVNDAFTSGTNFTFVDAKTRQRLTLDLDKGLSFFWRIVKNRHLRHTLTRSALNTHPNEASLRLLASVLRRTALKGGNACMPLTAHGLSEVFIDPALHYLTMRGAIIIFNRHLYRIECVRDRATTLNFADSPIKIGAGDNVICAIPPWNFSSIIPGISAPDRWRSILNAHFGIAPPPAFPKIMSVLNGTTEWVFAFPDRISITISDAGRFMQENRETLAHLLWQEVSAITGLPGKLPPWQIIKEKRATFAATPEQDKKRPGTVTPWRNLYLAGDWVKTGLPATIEGAIISGERAAKMILAKQ